MQLEADLVKQALGKEQEQMHQLREENQRLARQHEVLQAELQLALDNYTPKAAIDAGVYPMYVYTVFMFIIYRKAS